MTVLVIGPEELADIQALCRLAAENPVDVRQLMAAIDQPGVKAAHMRNMSAQTIPIPSNFLVTFSIESGHPAGTCRHMSMSVGRAGRAPSPHAVWMVAEAFGFVGGLDNCAVWKEELKGHDFAINVLQPLNVVEGSAFFPADAEAKS
jgi:hypothetical protein